VELHTIWFVLIAIFWVVFLVLEGFDFGVGMLHTIVAKTDTERRVALNTIGPWWDGNEVWLVIAGASMFAAFPGWYATMFSALYLALVLVLLALMARGVAFEFKGKRDSAPHGPGAQHSPVCSSPCYSASGSATSSAACRSTRATSSPATSSTC
jgi:cytochrome d ubiquinol oxidase subunit II